MVITKIIRNFVTVNIDERFTNQKNMFNSNIIGTNMKTTENPNNDFARYGIKQLEDGLTIEKIKKDFPWILKAKIEDAVLGLYRKEGGKFGLKWYNGRWEDGIFKDAIWETGVWDDGVFENSTWLCGNFYGGAFQNSNWNDGVFYRGIFNNSYWYSGNWCGGGIWYNSMFYDRDIENYELYEDLPYEIVD